MRYLKNVACVMAWLLISSWVVPTGVTPKAATITFRGNTFDVYTATYPAENIQLYWKNDKDEKLVNFSALKQLAESKNQRLVFAMNAGMYTEDNSPLGLYIENGKQLVPIRPEKDKGGNFYMQPNGVFLLTANAAKVVTTPEFEKYKAVAQYATQSGPMLVTKGEINALFKEGSVNKNIRNGVGVNKNGEVVLVISNAPTNFHDFALLFKQELHCDNALYLDGAISGIYLPELNRNNLNGNFGPMVGITVGK